MGNVITLQDFLTEVESGVPVVQDLTDGRQVTFQVHSPTENQVNEIRNLFGEVLSRNKELLDASVNEESVEIKDPAVLVKAGQIDAMCLKACVNEINESNVMGVIAQLPPQSDLLNECKKRCGMSAQQTEYEDEDDE